MESNWKPVFGYEDMYWIDKDGHVKNKEGHILQLVPSKEGYRVELRKNGQRERILIVELLCLSGWLQ